MDSKIAEVALEALIPYEVGIVKSRLNSIKQHKGLLPPIVIADVDGDLLVTDGTHRAYISIKDGKSTIAAVYATPDNIQLYEYRLVIKKRKEAKLWLADLPEYENDNARDDATAAEFDDLGIPHQWEN
jgi:hypothetical protein